MSDHGIGAPLVRREDARFLQGRGRYLDDDDGPGRLRLAFVRSAHAHAAVRRIDLAPALALPGVVAAFTGSELAAQGLGTLPCNVPVTSADGSPMAAPPRPPLATDRVRHVGEPVAVVAATTAEAAREAAEAVRVELDPLPVATGFGPGAPALWPEAPDNIAFTLRWGDPERTSEAFRRASRVVALEVPVNRVVHTALETRGVIAVPEPDGGLTLTVSNQAPHRLRRTMSMAVLGIPETKLRIVAPDIGGGFGAKLACYPEDAAAAWLALRLGRPVKWIADRSEAFLADTHARDLRAAAELALDDDGRFLAVRIDAASNLGAYLSQACTVAALEFGVSACGVYDIPAADVRVRGVFSNTAPTDVLRGVGRAEATFVLERLVDAAARELGRDRADLRRGNLVRPEALPATNAVGATYDSGDFPAALDAALDGSGWSGFERRRESSRARGRLRGIGLATYVQNTTGDASGVEIESARLRLHPTGTATLILGTHSHGQGHETVFAQLVSDRLGLPIEAIDVVYGDTGRAQFGRGTYGSRSVAIGGSATLRAVEKIVAKGRRIAAHLLETAVTDVGFAEGAFAVVGTDRRVTLGQVALAAYVPHDFPHDELEPGLDELAVYAATAPTYPNGAHVAEVEVDPETGKASLVGYWAVDDVGLAVNPRLVEGQVQGGVAQGVGQALLEACVYDPATGQLLTGSLMDYAVPRADDLPAILTSRSDRPCRTNPLGVKGAGEPGAVAAPPAVANAILDALAPVGVRDIAWPATPERIWRAIRSAGA
jgi:carbon-monoxide dehydrogenase large subunit